MIYQHPKTSQMQSDISQNPVTWAVYQAYRDSEKDGRRKKGIYSIGWGSVKTAKLSSALTIKEKSNERAFWKGGGAFGSETEHPELIKDEILDLFTKGKEKSNKRLIVIASAECPIPERWDPSISVDVILVPVRKKDGTTVALTYGSEKLKAWEKFCKDRNGRFKQVLSSTEEVLKKPDEAKVLYNLLSKNLKPRNRNDEDKYKYK